MNTCTKSRRPPVVLLMGPTAVGKTAFLEALFPGRAEVVSADALQVYRGLDIGTAKPDRALRSRLPHHLIDIVDFWETFTAGDFIRQTDILIPEIHARGKIPVLSGGTAFYLKCWLTGLPPLPRGDSRLRQALQERQEREGLASLHEELAVLDPPSAQRISPGDGVRIFRALEVYQLSGRPLSSFPLSPGPRQDYDLLVLELTRPREELYQRINLRVEAMFSQGLAEEVEALKKQGARGDHPGMKGIGYREFFLPPGEKLPPQREILLQVQQHTRRYAKRQLCFFRRLPGGQPFPAEDLTGVEKVLEAFLQQST